MRRLRQRNAAERVPASDGGVDSNGAHTMHALQDFFTTDYGLLSAAVIAITLGMGVFYARYFQRHIREDTAAEAARQAARR
jgi:hypothetical protein